MNKDCNYKDNYYGDQICQETGQPKQLSKTKDTKEAKDREKDCNYKDNYYGDQICQESQPAKPA